MVRLVDAGSVMVVGDLLEVWVDSIEVKEASVTGLDSLLPLHKRMSVVIGILGVITSMSFLVDERVALDFSQPAQE